jgi:hypothetical protein
MFYIVNNYCPKIIICMFFLQKSANKALELDINIFLQNMIDIYFSCKAHHKIRLTTLDPNFSEQHVIYYAFSKKIAIIRIK